MLRLFSFCLGLVLIDLALLDNDGKWGIRIESALMVRRMKVRVFLKCL